MNNTVVKKTERRKRIIRYAPLFIWLAFILLMSSSAGAMSETSRFIGPLLRYLFPDAAPETLALIHGYIRKSAHLFEYGVLAFFAWAAFRGSSVGWLSRNRYVAAFAVVAAVAVTDEINQSFLQSRTGTPWDVALDCVGGLIVLVFIAAARRFRDRRAQA